MIFFECYTDESLLRCLGLNSRELRGGHSFGRSRVSAKLKIATNSIGLVDEDPNSPQDPYLKHLLSLKPLHKDDYLICVKDTKNNKLLVLRPNLEEWVLKLAYDKKINLTEKYQLPNSWKALHEFLMREKNFRGRENFIKFISDISDHKTIIKLKELIKL